MATSFSGVEAPWRKVLLQKSYPLFSYIGSSAFPPYYSQEAVSLLPAGARGLIARAIQRPW
jgi:hypothetical protein